MAGLTLRVAAALAAAVSGSSDSSSTAAATIVSRRRGGLHRSMAWGATRGVSELFMPSPFSVRAFATPRTSSLQAGDSVMQGVDAPAGGRDGPRARWREPRRVRRCPVECWPGAGRPPAVVPAGGPREPAGGCSGGDDQRVVSRAGRHRHLGPAVGLANLVVVHRAPVEHDGRGLGAAREGVADDDLAGAHARGGVDLRAVGASDVCGQHVEGPATEPDVLPLGRGLALRRSEEHTSELQSPVHLVCRLLLEKKKKKKKKLHKKLKKNRIK